MKNYEESAARMALFVEKTNKSQAEIARHASLNSATLSRIASGKQVLGKTVISALSAAFDVNSEWLLTGKGEMGTAELRPLDLVASARIIDPDAREAEDRRLKEPELPYATYKESRTDYNVSNQVSRDKPNMWLVPIKAQAGFAKRFDDPVFRGQMQRVAFPMVMGECFGFEVEGKSMQPKYDPYSWVVCTLIDDYTWLRKGKNYVFQTYEGIYIKQFDQIEDNIIRMVSINPEYNPVEGLPLSETRKLYAIEGKYVKE
ncbi:MAG: XRE family transcriptional regulator [Pedobacter sp.]|nr:MAG: XRE family transcriptional regulator [Pedobacter sp.]